MEIAFKPLLTLQVTHEYYAGLYPDLRIVIPDETARALSARHLIARTVDGTLHLLYESLPGPTPIVPFAGTSLRFGLAADSAFSTLTALTLQQGTQVLSYRNTAVPGALDTPITLAIAGSPSAEVPGTSIYLNPELRQASVIAVLDLSIDAGFAATPPTFTVSFAARTEVLKYYVVSDYPNDDFAKLNVVDTGFAAQGRPQVFFDKIEVAGFTPAEFPPDLLAQNNEKVVLFRSTAPVARRQAARKMIQLDKDGEILIPNLPQPGPSQPRADVIVHLSKP